MEALAFFTTCIRCVFPEVIHTQKHDEGDHLPLPHSEALVQQHQVRLQGCSLVKKHLKK